MFFWFNFESFLGSLHNVFANILSNYLCALLIFGIISTLQTIWIQIIYVIFIMRYTVEPQLSQSGWSAYSRDPRFTWVAWQPLTSYTCSLIMFVTYSEQEQRKKLRIYKLKTNMKYICRNLAPLPQLLTSTAHMPATPDLTQTLISLCIHQCQCLISLLTTACNFVCV